VPDFPRYQSKGQITTQQPAVQAADDTTGEMLGQVAKVGQNVQEAAFKWSNTVDTVQKTAATANFKSGLLDITQRAQDDPDYNNSDQYFKEIEKLRTQSLKGFSSKAAEAQAAVELGYDAKVAQIQIQNLYKKKMIDVGQASMLKLIDTEINNPSESSLSNIQNILNTQVASGIVDHKDAYKLYQDSEQKVKFNTFLRDFRNDPVAAEKAFTKNTYGLDIETSEKARIKLKELKAMQREQEGNLYGDMSLRVTTGEITEDEINEAIAANKANPNEGITEAHGKQLINAYYKDVTKRIGAKEFKKHRQAIDFVFADSYQDRIKGYDAILEAYTDGLTKEESQFLKKILDTKKDVQFANKAAAGKKMLETLLGARPKDIQRETQSLLSYAQRIAEGMTPEAAAQSTALDIIHKDHPATVADPDLLVAFTPMKGLRNIPKVKRENSA